MRSQFATKPLLWVLVLVCACALAVMAGCSSGASSRSTASTQSAASDASSTSSVLSKTSASSPAAPQSSAASAASGQLTAESAVAQGYQVFEGTVRVGDASEIVKLQGSDISPSAVDGQNGTYAVLVFDQPLNVTGMSGDGSGQRNETAKMLGIAQYVAYSSFVDEYGNLEMCKSLNGQHVTLVAKAQDIWFPSDVRLPVGEPSTREAIFLS